MRVAGARVPSASVVSASSRMVVQSPAKIIVSVKMGSPAFVPLARQVRSRRRSIGETISEDGALHGINLTVKTRPYRHGLRIPFCVYRIFGDGNIVSFNYNVHHHRAGWGERQVRCGYVELPNSSQRALRHIDTLLRWTGRGQK